jgi:transposase-like protein
MITEQGLANSLVNENPQQQPVAGATEVRFRCPHCQKLYCTTTDVFEGDEPSFDCAACDKAFKLTT